ncbi:ATP-binding cassette a-factor transporter STE6 CYBJADRAFT_127994 [Cyberlindnera jadinii NRRL Y-1542]|uniref:P-loop containing nucleoside triphosphate hydrolase protein n=1 Tax=Cyberlindnera jadinii (strain ATCC 18201 / CBS 1600 / BCRC 20928 / JCM 3617 / NBRC 0987 / NRRL Y-1542) TaxID=983966 RepID=A0A1E4S1G2_CYBJN|nr:hypothetical protein CYBJADRAFT_127994 [Cyberlindnera jadinii NRRL Y-1542]ODV73329.1 hypothetical protein CYBJADRAFT_127994 [Cyberlindnera jadinii NRRL Y-1542]
MFADRSDIPLMIFGGVATIAGSLGPAISAILMGRVFNVLSSLVNGEFESVGDYMQEIRLSTMALIALGAGSVLIVWATVTCWMHIGERHGIRARLHMLNTFLKKPISWYEENEKVMGDLTQINRCVEELRAGTAEATALVAQNTVATAALLGTSFYYSWSVTLIMICSSPLIIASVVVFSRLMEKYTNKENDHSIEAAKVLDWSLISAKIVRLFSARDIEYEKFSRKVTDCKDAYTKLSLVSSINMGIVRFIILCMFVQGFWFGSDQIGRGNVSSGDVLTCFTSCLMIGETLRSTLPQIITIQKAIVAINRIQDLVIEAVKTWRKGKTTIILTHEFNQIGPDDYVYLMEDGRVAEQGLRKDMENAQIFQYLVSLQDNYKPQEEDNMSSEMHIEESFLNRVANRISTQFLSSVNPLSYYQTHEMENSIAPHPRAINRTIGERKLDEEEIEERPSLSPIRYIVNRMMQTVEKKWALAFGIGIAVINGAAGPVFSYAFAHLLSGIVPQDDGVGSPYYLLKWSMIVLAVAFVDGASLFLKEFLLNYSAEVWVYGLRKQAFRKISKQGMAWFSKTINNAAEVNTLLMNDCRDLRSLISHFLGVITSVTVLCTMGLTWALVEGWKLSLVCISMLPAFVITSSLYAFLLQMSENEYKNAVATLESHLYETVKGYKTIRTLRLEKHFESKFHEKIDVLKRAASRRALYTGMGVAISNLLVFVVQGVLLYYGMKLVGDGEYDVMQLMTTFVLLVFSIMNCVQMINQIPDISRGQRAGTYVFNIIDLPDSDIESKGDTIPDLNTNATAQFKNVSFCYPSAPGQKVLKNVNLEINRDETVAIIGESGSGKSTLALLITRLYESKGTFFDEVDLNSIELKWLRSQISVVDQKASFFDGSIRDNVTYGLDNYDDEDLISALKLANIYEFIISLPEGLDTRIETSLISGGQAQRLSIARAVIRKPKLLILDECTSALDAESTSKIAQLVKENLKDISVMMITHSKEMMKVADRLVVLNNGRVVEEGTYQDLYRKRGEMFRIVTAGQNS